VETPAFRPGRKRRFTSPEVSAVSDSVFVCPATGSSPTPAQEAVLRDHCGHARYVWNLAVEQHSWWHPGRKSAPGLPAAVPAAHPGPGGAPVAGRRLPHGAAAGAAGLRPGDGRVLRPAEPGRAAVVAQGRAARGIPDNRAARAAMGPGAAQPENRPGLGAQSRMGPVPLVPQDAKSYRGTRDRDIAAGHAVTARGGDGVARPVNREPQLLLQSA
jgi:hypothetical protein